MTSYKTVFGSLAAYQKGGVEVIHDNPKNYVFSNVFDVAAKSKPFERVAVGKNFEYVIECARAEGASSWYIAAHDEFALCMDGSVEVQLWKPEQPEKLAPPGTQGALKLKERPPGKKMGRVVIGRGHMALLPQGAAYQFNAGKPGVLLIQTIQGQETVEKWSQICQVS
jgi:hypothetical protein